MIPNRNLDSQRGIKSTGNGKYLNKCKITLFLFLDFHITQIIKTKIIILSYGLYHICDIDETCETTICIKLEFLIFYVK